MNRDEFDRLYGTNRKYATVIFVPHASAKFRKLKISHRLIFMILSFWATTLLLCAYFALMYFVNVRDELLARTATTRQLEHELTDANKAMLTSVANMERLTRHLLHEQRQREQELGELQQRYDSLRVLTQGQEKIAEAHRAILQRRTVVDRVIEIGFGFFMGVVSSLVASMLWRLWNAPQVSDSEAKALELDE